MKVGDKVFCKRTYTKLSYGNKVIIYLKGASYEIIFINDYTINIHSVTMNKNYSFRLNAKSGFLSDICPLFGGYFMTLSNIRKQKLKKLKNESR